MQDLTESNRKITGGVFSRLLFFLFTYYFEDKKIYLTRGGNLSMIYIQNLKKMLRDIKEFKTLYQYRSGMKTIQLEDTVIECDFSLWKPTVETVAYMLNTEENDDELLIPYNHIRPRTTMTCCGFFQKPKVVLERDTFTDHPGIPYAWEFILLHECGHYLLQPAFSMYTGDVFIRWSDPGVMHQVMNEYSRHKEIQFHRDTFDSEKQFNHTMDILHIVENIHHRAIHRNIRDVHNLHSINLAMKTKRSMIWDAIRSTIDSWMELYDHWESAEYYMAHAEEPIKIKNELEADLFAIANFPEEHGNGFYTQMRILSNTQKNLSGERKKFLRKGFSEEHLDGFGRFLEVYSTILECIFDSVGFDAISEVYKI